MKQPQERTVYVVDDNPAVRDSVALLLSSEGYRVRPFASVFEFEEGFDPEGVCCVVLDVLLPGKDGLELQEDLARWHPEVPIVFISGHADVKTAVHAFRRDAVHLLQKPYHEDELLESIEEAFALAVRWKEQAAARQLVSTLTRREAEVLDFMVSGRSTRIIAADIERSPKTIEAHRRSIMRKLRATNIAEVVRIAMTARASTRSRVHV